MKRTMGRLTRAQTQERNRAKVWPPPGTIRRARLPRRQDRQRSRSGPGSPAARSTRTSPATGPVLRRPGRRSPSGRPPPHRSRPRPRRRSARCPGLGRPAAPGHRRTGTARPARRGPAGRGPRRRAHAAAVRAVAEARRDPARARLENLRPAGGPRRPPGAPWPRSRSRPARRGPDGRRRAGFVEPFNIVEAAHGSPDLDLDDGWTSAPRRRAAGATRRRAVVPARPRWTWSAAGRAARTTAWWRSSGCTGLRPPRRRHGPAAQRHGHRRPGHRRPGRAGAAGPAVLAELATRCAPRSARGLAPPAGGVRRVRDRRGGRCARRQRRHRGRRRRATAASSPGPPARRLPRRRRPPREPPGRAPGAGRRRPPAPRRLTR